MNKSTRKESPSKQDNAKRPKPYPGFPLTPHNGGKWMKKIRGKLHYFGRGAQSYAAWNAMPLVVYHPIRNGNPISARSSEVLNSQGIGIVRRSRIASNGKLVPEGWFDIERTRRVDRRVLHALQRGDQIELSTGLFTDAIPVRNGSHHNGKPYTHVAKNFRPDHLAILPDQLGACSIKDGCGVGVDNSKRQGHPLIPPKMVW